MLTPKQSAYCPTCKRYTSQERGAERGTRYCGCCGNTFTLEESRRDESAAATAAPVERIPSVRVATAGDNEAAINNLYYVCDHCWHSMDYGQVYTQGDSTCPKCNQGIMREIAPLNIPPPAIGAKLLCLVCAHYKPWGIFSSRTGESVCADCRDIADKARCCSYAVPVLVGRSDDSSK